MRSPLRIGIVGDRDDRITAHQGYHCRYGLNPEFRQALVAAQGEVRAIERNDHPFFVATLFQPERAALRGQVPPLVRAFVLACTEAAGE